MIRVSEIKLPVEHDRQALEQKIMEKLALQQPPTFTIRKRSIDARRKDALCYSYTVDVQVSKRKEEKILKKHRRGISKAKKVEYVFPYRASEVARQKRRPIIIGTGPAGLYCGLMLARAGYRPILLERGMPIEQRVKAVEGFWNGQPLRENGNVQFGEGGAGTFSDGKLNTSVNDKSGRNMEVLREFALHGAKEEILYDGKPHIGTDCLRDIIINMRNTILQLGGDIRFLSQVTTIAMDDNKKVTGVWVNEGGDDAYFLEADIVVLAPGHSARDTFFMLHEKDVEMEAKAFAMGVRVEHEREKINRSQYGTTKQAALLGTAPYKVTAKTKEGRNVYSFCMCPGGFVVNASSKRGYLAINGMSNADRMADNSNAAIVVNVTKEDFGKNHPLSGVLFQEKWEKKAYELCNGSIPVQLWKDFKENRQSSEFGTVRPSMKGAYAFGNIRECLPDYICEAICEAMEKFDRQIEGYAKEDTLFSGIESRTSSPVRIVRDGQMESNIKGLFPCGEGAGYAGGITSAAIDGIRVAEEVARRMNEELPR